MIIAYMAEIFHRSDYEQMHIAYQTPKGIIREWCSNDAHFEPDRVAEKIITYETFAEVRKYFKDRYMDIIHDDGED